MNHGRFGRSRQADWQTADAQQLHVGDGSHVGGGDRSAFNHVNG